MICKKQPMRKMVSHEWHVNNLLYLRPSFSIDLKSRIESLEQEIKWLTREKEQLQLTAEKSELLLNTLRTEIFRLERKCDSQSKEISKRNLSMSKTEKRALKDDLSTSQDQTNCSFINILSWK